MPQTMQSPVRYAYWFVKFWIHFYFGGKYFNKSAWVPVKDRKVLFARSRSQHTHFYCVGGKIEKGETDIDALIREAREEVDVSLIESTILPICTFYGPAPDGRPMRMSVYDAKYEGVLKPSNEVEELAWFTKTYNSTTYMGELIIDWMYLQGRID
jgi:8-oxo-dGTP diphosphatase